MFVQSRLLSLTVFLGKHVGTINHTKPFAEPETSKCQPNEIHIALRKRKILAITTNSKATSSDFESK